LDLGAGPIEIQISMRTKTEIEVKGKEEKRREEKRRGLPIGWVVGLNFNNKREVMNG
jgi:hypothetical protein